MKIARAVALVIGADSAVGASVVRGLLARGVGKVYADAHLDSCEIALSGAVPLFVAIGRQARAAKLARDLTDVNLLVNCLVARHDSASPSDGTHPQARDPHTPSVGRILKLIDAFAPVLSANGGGAVVNVLCMLHADHLSECAPTTPSRPLAEWMLAAGTGERLAAQRTQLLFLSAQLVIGTGFQARDDQGALAGHVAMRLLNQLEAGDHGLAVTL